MGIKFDEYTLKARYAPAVLVSLPVIILAPMLITDILGIFKAGIISVGGAAPLWLLLCQTVRMFGLRTQEQLVKEWGGLPTTLIMQWRDKNKSRQFKKRTHELILEKTGIHLSTESEEAANPEEADKRIVDAFGYLKDYVWGKKDLSTHSHNIHYGFARNLYGARLLWLALSLIMLIAVIVIPVFNNNSVDLKLIIIGLVFLIFVPVIEWLIVKPLVKHCAYRYAEAAWNLLPQLPSYGGRNGQ